MSFAAAERATTQPDATTDRAANALRQLRQNVALLERLCDMVDSAGPAGADAELRQQVAVQRGVVEDLTRATRRHLTELLRDAENSPPATAPRRRAAHVFGGVVPFFLRRVDGVEARRRRLDGVEADVPSRRRRRERHTPPPTQDGKNTGAPAHGLRARRGPDPPGDAAPRPRRGAAGAAGAPSTGRHRCGPRPVAAAAAAGRRRPPRGRAARPAPGAATGARLEVAFARPDASTVCARGPDTRPCRLHAVERTCGRGAPAASTA